MVQCIWTFAQLYIWISWLELAIMSLRDVSHPILSTVFGSLCLLQPVVLLKELQCIDFETSGWLIVIPLVCHCFDLSPYQICDSLSLQHHRPLGIMSSYCDNCCTFYFPSVINAGTLSLPSRVKNYFMIPMPSCQIIQSILYFIVALSIQAILETFQWM